jgi:hypothetical protein
VTPGALAFAVVLGQAGRSTLGKFGIGGYPVRLLQAVRTLERPGVGLAGADAAQACTQAWPAQGARTCQRALSAAPPACTLQLAGLRSVPRHCASRSPVNRLPNSVVTLQAPRPRGQELTCSSSEACCAAHGAPSGRPDLGIECSVQKCQGASGVLLDARSSEYVLANTVAPVQLLQPGRMSASSLFGAVFIGHSFPIADSSFARVDATHWVRLHGTPVSLALFAK